ncbi:MAG: sensor histidine kinase [Cytophagales bacterium]|nr:sensor histidine kinase [Cytophagales bacterium]
MYKHILIIGLIFITLTISAEGVLELGQNTKVEKLSKYIDYYVHNTPNSHFFDTIPREHCCFKKWIDDAAPISNPDVWLKVSIKNNDPISTQWYFSLGETNQDITVYKFKDSVLLSTQKAGFNIPQRDRLSRKYAFLKFNIAKDDINTFYIHVVNRDEKHKQFFPFSIHSFCLYSESEYYDKFTEIKYTNFLFYGALISLLIYNFVIFYFIRDKMFVGYVSFIFLLLLYNLSLDGTLLELAFENIPYADFYLRIGLEPLIIIGFLYTSKEFLRMRELLPGYNMIINLIIGLNFIIFLLYAFDLWYIGRVYTFMMAVVSFGIIMISSVIIITKKHVPAQFYLASTLILVVMISLFVYYNLGRLPNNELYSYIEYIPKVATLLQLTVLSISFAYRIKTAESELIKEQLLRANEKQIIIEEKNRELQEKVRARTIELEDQKQAIIIANERLEEKVRERTKKLQKAYRDLLNLNYELDSFIYRAAHDIRGPITTIMGLCNIALMEKDFNKCQEYLFILDKFSKSTQLTLNRILSVNDIKNNHIKLAEFNIDDLKETVSALLINNPDKNAIKITFDFPQNHIIYADMYLLQLILLNLIDNSIRFRKHDTNIIPTCHVSLVIDENFYRFTVKDNGVGINDAIKDKVFDMFFRGSEYSSGSGLGLYIAKIASKKLNGEVILLNTDAKETTFLVEIPILKIKERFIQQEDSQTNITSKLIN